MDTPTLTHPTLIDILSKLNYSDDVISAGLGVRNFGMIKFAKKGDQQTLDELKEVIGCGIRDLEVLSSAEGIVKFAKKAGVDTNIVTNAIHHRSLTDIFKCLIGWKNHITFAQHREHYPTIIKNLEKLFGYSFTIQTASEISSLTMGMVSFHKHFDNGVSLLIRFSYQRLVFVFTNSNGDIIAHFDLFIRRYIEEHYFDEMKTVS